MSLAIICPGRDMRAWISALKSREPQLEIELWPDIADPAAVEFALVWKHPSGALTGMPNLRCISSLGAGVDSLLQDPQLPAGVPLVRIVDDQLKQSMAEYICLGALQHFRQFELYRQQQADSTWQIRSLPHISTMRVGILGLGQLGFPIALSLAALGFSVHGWRRSAASSEGVRCFCGEEELAAFLGMTDILVCLLPLTPVTRDLLDCRLFRQLPAGAFIINVARGELLVEQDLLEAIDSGHLAGALLDVFRQEPLPSDHPYWLHPRIRITPHIASITNPESAVLQVLENYRRALSGQTLLHSVDRQRGY